ncbi:threonylcarbamoyl-AMP synthase [Candidatus Parcubacteria bacterium]|nr:threonylcarbamoyl-AMP synthase [Candidatus Parcubacteria bacterium]
MFNKNLFFIDFDDTLFNTKKFKKDLIKIFSKNNINTKQFAESYYDYPLKKGSRLCKYDPEHQIKKLSEKYKIDKIKLKNDIDEFTSDTSKFLFKDTLAFLQKLKKEKNNRLILISFGKTKFQRKKILNSGIRKFFHEIIITDKKKIDLIKKHKKTAAADYLYFLEDHPKQLNYAKNKIRQQIKSNSCFKKFFIIRVKHNDGRYSKIKTESDFYEIKKINEFFSDFNKLFKINNAKQANEAINLSVKILKNSGVAVFPTETAYGLAADFTDKKAVDKIFKIKQRKRKKLLPIIASDIKMAKKYFNFDKNSLILAKKYWPGPLTLILNKRGQNRGKGIAVRVSNNKFTNQLAKKLGKPITATSANISGQNLCYDIFDVIKQMRQNRIKPDIFLDAGTLPKNPPSTIIDARSEKIKTVRQGKIKIL